MHDPLTLAFSVGSWLDIWHKDPERDGTDDSCDWFGRKRPQDSREKALSEAIWRAENVFGNAPYYPDTDAYRAFHEIEQAKYEWRRRVGRRWHPRWHFHHWRIRFWPVIWLRRWLFDRCSTCGERFRWRESAVTTWDGDRTEHLRHHMAQTTR